MGLSKAEGNWFHRHYKSLAKAVGAVCPRLGQVIELIGDSGVTDSWATKINDADLSPADKAILEPWDNTKFTPFYTDLAHSFQVNVLDTTKNLQTRIQFLNSIYLQMAAVVLYYKNNETAGLSADGIANRNGYIDSTFGAIYSVVEDDPQLGALLTIDISKNFKSIDLKYLQIPTTSADFTISTTVFQTNSGTPVVATPAQVATAPQITPDAVAQLIDQVKGTTTVLDTPKETIPPTPPTSSSHTGIKILGFGLLVALALKFGFKTKK